MKTAILFSSSRAKGDTFQIAEYIRHQSSADLFHLADYSISFYDYEHANKDDDFLTLVSHLVKYEHIVFATPMYWYSMCAQMKVFIDRLSDLLTIEKDLGRQLKGKSWSVVSTGYDAQAPDCLWQPFDLTAKYLSVEYLGLLYCPCPQGFSLPQHKQSIDNFINNILAGVSISPKLTN
ncbi:flavodoxin family protein [Paraglaciecola sp. 2405UD69-4]|uniref:flavodoxin family protein n=1 Tax=Paraglaciecola sp. 2405UD69-4 TaxID=3391836 RepID=UPI0039C9625C